MPKFIPNTIIKDCWSSIGNITFYHKKGKCYYRRKAHPIYPGTPSQLNQAQVHHRAILAWQNIPHEVQLQWNDYAKTVPSHRPPYDKKNHISGYNLFVSAYHGFAQINQEHIPEPKPFPQFPLAVLEIIKIKQCTGIAVLHCHLAIFDTTHPERWHLTAQIQLVATGLGCNPGLMRSYMPTKAQGDKLFFLVPDIGQKCYKVHIRYRLIDEITGYRNNWSYTQYTSVE